MIKYKYDCRRVKGNGFKIKHYGVVYTGEYKSHKAKVSSAYCEKTSVELLEIRRI